MQRNNIHTRVERRRSRNRGEVNSASVSRNVPRSINPKRYYAFHPFVVVVASRRVVQRTRTYERLFIFDFPRICLSTCCVVSLSLPPCVFTNWNEPCTHARARVCVARDRAIIRKKRDDSVYVTSRTKGIL